MAAKMATRSVSSRPTFMALILLTVTVLGSLPTGQCRFIPGVTILSDTGSDIYVHCKSADDDIGEHKLAYGQMLHWTFRPNLQTSTLYWCSFSWVNPETGQAMAAAFDVWSVGIVRTYLSDPASWKVEKDGFYLYDLISQTFGLISVWQPAAAASTTKAL